MPLFDNIKKSLGLSKEKQQSQGYILGHASQPQQSQQPVANSSSTPEAVQMVNDEFWEFELEFTAEKLGMTIQEAKSRVRDPNGKMIELSQAMVAAVAPNSQAALLEVKVGDLITMLNGHTISVYDDFYNFLVGVGRPVRISILRRKEVSPPPGSKLKSGLQTLFRNFSPGSQSTVSTPPPPQQPVISEEEKNARREAMRKAANDRSQQWDRKLGASKRQPSEAAPQQVCTVENHNNPETLAHVQKTKQMEAQIEQRLGYSPFRPHMSFTGTGLPPPSNPGMASTTPPPVSVIPPSTSTSSLSSSFPPSPPPHAAAATAAAAAPVEPYALTAEEEGIVVADVDDAFAMLLSLSDDEQDRVKVAVQTVQKMLQNLYSNRSEVKFRSIRLSNKAFQSKVGSVPGAIELLLAGGFVLYEESVASDSPGESTLQHPMSSFGLCKLEYTLSRLQELLDGQSQNTDPK